MTSAVPNDELLSRIRRKRADMDAFLSSAQPRKRRLINTTIVGGTLAAAFTAGPAVGGQSFTAFLTTTLGLKVGSPGTELEFAL